MDEGIFYQKARFIAKSAVSFHTIILHYCSFSTLEKSSFFNLHIEKTTHTRY